MNDLPEFISREINRLSKTKKDIDNDICNQMFEYIDAHPDKNWKWDALSANPNITMDYIDEHPKKLNMFYASNNPNVTFNYIITHLEYNWNWCYLSDIFPVEFKKYHQQYPWKCYKQSNLYNMLDYLDHDNNRYENANISDLIASVGTKHLDVISQYMFTKEKTDLINETAKSFIE